MEYRPVPEAHRRAFRDLVRYAFAPERGPDFEEDGAERPEIFEPRGLYDAAPETPTADLDADDLTAVCGYYDFEARVRGAWHPAPGVSVVASPPETRRSGNVARLFDALLAEFRDSGRYLSVLWPFNYAFYRRFGYAMANKRTRTTVAPAALDGAAADDGGWFRRLGPDDWAALDAVHRAHATEALALRRTEGWWRHRVFSTWRGDRYVVGWADDGRGARDLRGYLVYTVEDADGEGPDGRSMAVHDLAWTDHEARRQLLRFCRNHDSQVGTVELPGPADPGLLDLLSEPGEADVDLRPGPMVRAVDVPAAVEALDYPAGVEGRITVAVSDPRCPWNDGTFEVEVAGGAATCHRLDGDGSVGTPDVRCDIGTFSQLLVGATSIEALERHGDLALGSEHARETLAAAYPPEAVYLREFF